MRACDFPPKDIPEQDGVYCQGGLVCPVLPALPVQDFLVRPNPGAVSLAWTLWRSLSGAVLGRFQRLGRAEEEHLDRLELQSPWSQGQDTRGLFSGSREGLTSLLQVVGPLQLGDGISLGGGDQGASFNAKKDRKYMKASHLARVTAVL